MNRNFLRKMRGPAAVPSCKDFSATGIYFLYREGVVVYVGQAVDVRRRVGQHLAEGAKDFDSVSCMVCERGQLDALERRYIDELAPEYNRCSVAKLARQLGRSDTQQPDVEVMARAKPRSRARRALAA